MHLKRNLEVTFYDEIISFYKQACVYRAIKHFRVMMMSKSYLHFGCLSLMMAR